MISKSGKMNVISQFLYWLLLLPSPLYRRWGIHLPQLALILRYKLVMDDRRPNTFQQTRSGRKKEAISNATLGTMFMAFLLGFLYLVFFQAGADSTTHLFFFFAAFLFMLASMLITDFTSVLIDVRDNIIILPKPVNDSTVLMAKILHILVHLSRLVIPMSLPSMVYVFIQHGWLASIALLLMIAIACGFTIFLINAIYLLVLRITTAEKFKSFIAWFQIGFAILLYGGYQLIPRIADMEMVRQFRIDTISYAPFLPPYWFARGWAFCSGMNISSNWPWFLLSLLASGGSIWLVVRFFAPAFTRKLAGLSGGTATQSGKTAQRSGAPTTAKSGEPVLSARERMIADRPKHRLSRGLADALCKGSVEKAAFLFGWKWTARNREFKMKVYPSFGYVLVWFLLTFFRNGNSAQFQENALPIFLGLIYFSSFILINALQQINHTDQYKASWIFLAAPLVVPGPIVLGNYKSILAKFYLPIALLLSVVGIVWIGPKIVPNLILAFCNQLVICSLVLFVQHRKLPASLPPITQSKGSGFLQAILILLISGLVAGGHFLLFRFLPVVSILAVLSAIASWMLLDKIRRFTWNQLNG